MTESGRLFHAAARRRQRADVRVATSLRRSARARARFDVRPRGQQGDTAVRPVQSRFRIDLQYALYRLPKEAPEVADRTVAVAELSGQLQPAHAAGPSQREQSMHQPRVDVQIHRTLAQLTDRTGGERRGTFSDRVV